MSTRQNKKTGYRIFTKEFWFDFEGPSYLFGKCVSKEAIDTSFMFFWVYEN